MAKFSKASGGEGVSGSWVDRVALKEGATVTIVTEATEQPNTNFPDEKTGKIKMRVVCKVRVTGSTEALNLALSKPTVDALIDAYGDDSVMWQGHPLKATKTKAPRGWSVHLIPKGYELGYNGDWPEITKMKKGSASKAMVEDPEEDTDVADSDFK